MTPILTTKDAIVETIEDAVWSTQDEIRLIQSIGDTIEVTTYCGHHFILTHADQPIDSEVLYSAVRGMTSGCYQIAVIDSERGIVLERVQS